MKTFKPLLTVLLFILASPSFATEKVVDPMEQEIVRTLQQISQPETKKLKIKYESQEVVQTSREEVDL